MRLAQFVDWPAAAVAAGAAGPGVLAPARPASRAGKAPQRDAGGGPRQQRVDDPEERLEASRCHYFWVLPVPTGDIGTAVPPSMKCLPEAQIGTPAENFSSAPVRWDSRL